MQYKILIACLLFTFVFVSCKQDPKIRPAIYVEEMVPEGWPQPVYTFSTNTVSENRFILGRELFYDPMLSKNNTISCGSCHQQSAAFANTQHKTSHGINGLFGNRNSPALFNLTWHPYFMHDGGVNHIEVQPLAPIANPVEMDENINNVLTKLQASEKYKLMFKKAFDSSEITSQRMLRALAQFMGLLYSNTSKYDDFKKHKTEFTSQELHGYDLFIANCNSCHREPLFSDFGLKSNGLAADPVLKDSGRAHITGLPADRYKFKTPSLRNIALSAPYMHDGRYTSLEECLNHYTNSISAGSNPDPVLNNGLQLSADDKKDLIAFLHTLSDFKFISDEKFRDPNFK